MLGVVNMFISSISPNGRVALRRNEQNSEISCENSSFTVCRKLACAVSSFIDDPTYAHGFSRESPNPLPALLFRLLWQTPFTPENRHIAEIILEFPLREFDVDTVVLGGAKFGFARIQIWHLLLLKRIILIVSGAELPVTVITIGKLRIPISPCVFDLLSSTL